MAHTIFVSGSNSGIGLALCRQLLVDHGCRVFMGARSLERGAAALATLALSPEPLSRATLVQCDVASEASVAAAAATVRAALGGAGALDALVNNAGTGLLHGSTKQQLIDTNFHGVVRMSAAFLPLLRKGGRIVNLGSGSGPTYVKALGVCDSARELVAPTSLAQIEAHIAAQLDGEASEKAYKGARVPAHPRAQASLSVEFHPHPARLRPPLSTSQATA